MKNYTFYGILAVLFWSTGIAISRSISEKFGVMVSHGIAFFISGLLGIGWFLVKGKAKEVLRKDCVGKSVLTGVLFVITNIFLYLSIYFANNHKQVIIVSIINYFWPSMTLLLSIPILGNKARIFIVFGIILSTLGVAKSILSSSVTNSQDLLDNIAWLPCLLSFSGATAWAFYSNFARKWEAVLSSHQIPVYMLMTSFVFFCFIPFSEKMISIDFECIVKIIYMATIPLLLAYFFWDLGIKKGNSIFLVSFSFLTPVFSILFSAIYLQYRLSIDVTIGCLMVLAGAFICKHSISEKKYCKSNVLSDN